MMNDEYPIAETEIRDNDLMGETVPWIHFI